MRVLIKRGLDLPLPGVPEQRIGPETGSGPPVRHVAVLGADYPGVRPSIAVSVNQRVRAGDVLFTDRHDPRLRVTAPAAGTVTEINRGAKRALTAIVIRVSGTDAVTVPALTDREQGDAQQLASRFLEAGLWPAFRERPFDRIPGADSRPHWLFVTAMDTHPHAPDPGILLAEKAESFADGLRALSVLSAGPVFVCHAPAHADVMPRDIDGVTNVAFAGPHPAGLPGTHIHHLARVSAEKSAWYINYQDVIAAGELVRRGTIPTQRLVALGGDGLKRPRVVRIPIGASIEDLLRDEAGNDVHVLSGSVLSGREAEGASAYVGRLHNQVSVLAPARKRNPYAPALSPARWWKRKRIAPRQFAAERSGFLPVEAFDRVWPMAAPPAMLLRALLAGDLETAEALDCLELAEEDLALCEFVCPANQNFRRALRRTLDQIAAQV